MGKELKKMVDLKDLILEGEVWKEVELYGMKGKYFVSSFGRVYSVFSSVLMKFQIDKGGYLFLTMTNKNNRKTIKTHRLVAEIFIPNINNKTDVNHKNKNKLDNRVENLEWVSSFENNLHRDGISVWNNNQTKITPSDYSVARRKLEGFSNKIIPMLKQIVPLV